MAVLLPQISVMVDWGDDGFSSGRDTNDEISLRTRVLPAPTWRRGRDQIRALGPPSAGRASVEVDNASKDYSPPNTASPIYATLRPGHTLRIGNAYLSVQWVHQPGIGTVYTTLLPNPSYVVAAGDQLRYSIRWLNTSDYTAIDLLDVTTLLPLSGTSPTDQNGQSAVASAGHTFYANNVWNDRIITLPAGWVGHTIGQMSFVWDNTGHSTGGGSTIITGYRNVVLTDANGRIKLVLWQRGAPAGWTDTVEANGDYGYLVTPLVDPRWVGVLDDIQVHPEPTRRTVTLPALGRLASLPGRRIDVGASVGPYSTGTAIAQVLGNCGFTSAQWVLDTGQTTFTAWWADDVDAWTALQQILDAEGPGARVFENAAGQIVFHDRAHNISGPGATSQATFTDTGTNWPIAAPFDYQPSYKNIVGSAKMAVNVRSLKPLTTVWTYGVSLVLAANETRYIRARAATGDPFVSAVAPTVAAGDYTVGAGALASAITLDHTGGPTCTLTVIAGAAGATLTGLRLRAQPYTIDGTNDLVNRIVAPLGGPAWTGTPWPEMTAVDAQALCDQVVAIYGSPRATVSFTAQGVTTQNAAQQETREIGDRITVVEGQSCLNGDVWIEQIAETATDGGLLRDVTYGCQVVWPQTWFVLDQSQLDINRLGF